MQNLTLSEIQSRMVELHGQVKSIVDFADNQNRETTASENSRIASLMAEFDILKCRHEEEQTLSTSAGRKTESMPRGKPGGAGKPLFQNAMTGETVRAFGHDEPMGDYKDQDPELFGKMLINMIRGDDPSHGLDVRNVATSGESTSGGYMVAPSFNQRIIDLPRSASIAMRAGAVSIQLPGGEMTLLRLTSDPESYWRNETEAVLASEIGMGRFVLRPRRLTTLLPFSLELAEDAENSAAVLQQAATNAMALKMDQAILSGSGTGGEPLGILNTDNVNSQSSIGSLSNFDEVIVGIRQIMQSNYPNAIENLSWVTGPEVAASYASLKTGISSDQSSLVAPEWVQRLSQFQTTSMSAQATSPITYQNLIGPFDQVLVGFRSAGMTVQILDSGTATDGDGTSWNAVTQHMRFLRISLRMDVAVLQPTWFAKLDGITV